MPQTQMAIRNPRGVGFEARYEWHGREQVIIWRHCGADAAQGPKDHRLSGSQRADYHTVVSCASCGLRWESRCLWEGVTSH